MVYDVSTGRLDDLVRGGGCVRWDVCDVVGSREGLIKMAGDE